MVAVRARRTLSRCPNDLLTALPENPIELESLLPNRWLEDNQRPAGTDRRDKLWPWVLWNVGRAG